MAKAMRGSFQDLARAAKVSDLVTRSISGHVTEQTQRLYSTVNDRSRPKGPGGILGLVQAPGALLSLCRLPTSSRQSRNDYVKQM
jgi:hypothetical protein